MIGTSVIIFIGFLLVVYGKHEAGIKLPPESKSIWDDYPAYALLQKPSGPSAEVIVIDRRKGKGKKATPVKIPSADPVFDIVVNPEYIPEPFPAPYPYPIEKDEPKKEASKSELPASHNPAENPATFANNDISEPSSRRPNYKITEYIERETPKWECPRGFVKSGSVCILTVSMAAEYGCPEGWKYEDGECRATEVANTELVCPDGFVQDNTDSSTCTQQLVSPKQMVCSDGYTATLRGCKKKTFTMARQSCSGALLEGGKCTRTLQLQPEIECGDGFVAGGDQLYCYRQNSIPATEACPIGYLIHNEAMNCVKNVISSPTPQCPFGFRVSGDSCVREISAPAEKFCMHGTLNPEGHCSSMKVYGSPVMGCHKDGVLHPLTGKCYARHTTKKHKHGVCPPDMSLIDGICVHEEVSDPVKQCPAGSKLVGKDCIGNAISQPLFKCPPGKNLQHAMCISTEATSLELSCMPGYNLTLDNKCVTVDSVKIQMKCPDGFGADEHGMCQKIEKMPSNLRCPTNSLLQKNIDDSYLCVAKESFDPEYECDAPNSSLELTSNGPKCVAWSVIEPNYICESGYTDVNNRCIKYLRSELLAACEDGFDLLFGKCVKQLTSPALVLCMDGYHLLKNSFTCSRETKTDMSPVCPTDMEFDPHVQECYKMNKSYDFDEQVKPLEIPRQTEPEEALKDLQMNVPTPPPPPPVPAAVDSPPMVPPYSDYPHGPGMYYPRELPMDKPVYTPPQVTIVQQPVVIPQPAVILPQQAPVPPPPTIRVPYAVPQPIPTPISKEKYVHHAVPVHTHAHGHSHSHHHRIL